MKLKLMMKADLEEITDIRPDDDISWELKVRHENGESESLMADDVQSFATCVVGQM
jgi:hypothetical protein